MRKIRINEDFCKGCELCTTACPKNIIVMAVRLNASGFHPAIVVDKDSCISCGFCTRMCPDVAITVWKEEKKHDEAAHEG